MNLRKIVVAIDGYSACGKSTTAREVARILGYNYIDSGAMYRAVTLTFLENHISLTNPKEIKNILDKTSITFRLNASGTSDTYLNGANVEHEIRKMRISENVSQVSTIKEVRVAMVDQQRKMGREKAIVMDGRDIGTVVFPEAELKVFMTADPLVRAIRRQRELLDMDRLVDLDDVIANIRSRDEIDTTRAESPLRKASDAIMLDTSHITITEQVDEVVRWAISKILRLSVAGSRTV